MKDFIKNNWHIILPELFVVLLFVLFYRQFGDIMVDSFREVYIPQQMIKGKTLYKDIFVIYPPLAYLINAFIMKIFGTSLNTLYFAGLFATCSIIFFTNKISEIFLNKIFSFGISLFLISGLVLSPNVFNSFLPYSFGILYGVLFVLISLYYGLIKRFPLMYLFYSLAILCKYEFVLLLPLLIYWSKLVNWKKTLISFILPIFMTSGILAIQGVRLNDIISTSSIINVMSSSKTLYWFYSVMGLTFRLELIPIYLVNIAKFLCPIYWIQYQEVIIWALPVILLLGIIRFKALKSNEIFFVISTLLISAKVFLALTLQSYGVYFLPFVLISLFILVPEKFRKILFGLMIIWSLIIGAFNINSLVHKNMKLDNVVKYIEEKTSETDKVVVYPECLAINVLTNRKSDNKFYSLTPLYVETLGEDLIIKRLEKVKPEYIIINNYDTSAYYFREFGVDYAQDILKWIEKNYKLQTTINDRWNFRIYRLN